MRLEVFSVRGVPSRAPGPGSSSGARSLKGVRETLSGSDFLGCEEQKPTQVGFSRRGTALGRWGGSLGHAGPECRWARSLHSSLQFLPSLRTSPSSASPHSESNMTPPRPGAYVHGSSRLQKGNGIWQSSFQRDLTGSTWSGVSLDPVSWGEGTGPQYHKCDSISRARRGNP